MLSFHSGKGIIRLATGLLFLQLMLSVAFAAPAKKEESVTTLNFNNTDITAVIAAVSEMTGRNFIIDPRVKGKVTIISNHAMSASDIYDVFLSVLKVHGFAAIPGDNVIKIVPEVGAKQDAIRTATGKFPGGGDEFVTRVIEIKYVNAAQLVPILRPLVPQRGHLAAYPGSNVLVISDSAANITRLVRIIRRIDQASGDEIEVVALEHASASEVVRIITRLKPGDPKQPDQLKIVADERSNSVLIGGDKSDRVRLRALISHLDTPVALGGNTHVIYLKNAEAKKLVPVLTGVSQGVAGGKGNKTATSENIIIQADENTNALVINAPPDVFRSLRGVVQKLDVRRAQVLVEAIIAEVKLDKTRELGVQWLFDGSSQDQAVGFINFSSIGGLGGLLSTPPTLSDGIAVAGGDFNGTTRFGALLRALSGDSESNILSTPSLVTLDNEEAEIVVGQNVPFLTGSYSSTGSGSTPSNPFQTVQREDVGLTLKIKPQINEGNAIKLEVDQEVSSVTDSTLGVDLITQKRAIKTNVIVEDNEVVVLGGLVQDELRETEQRVPGLGDIPILGWLFRSSRTTKVKTNLMVFIHPVILKDAAVSANYTADKYNYMRAKQMATREDGVSLMYDDESPVLPEMKELLILPPTFEDYQKQNDAPPSMEDSSVE
ncbi:MAG: type II secretion system secretin GspD [Gammaproteobacteria bacterium]